VLVAFPSLGTLNVAFKATYVPHEINRFCRSRGVAKSIKSAPALFHSFIPSPQSNLVNTTAGQDSCSSYFSTRFNFIAIIRMAMPPHSRAGGSSTAQRGATAAASSSSQTTTIHSPSTRQQHPVLRLRGAMRSPGERSDRRIQWAEDVIDNEGLGRKSSKGMSPSLLPPHSSPIADYPDVACTNNI
jgi:hypothetical protein